MKHVSHFWCICEFNSFNWLILLLQVLFSILSVIFRVLIKETNMHIEYFTWELFLILHWIHFLLNGRSKLLISYYSVPDHFGWVHDVDQIVFIFVLYG